MKPFASIIDKFKNKQPTVEEKAEKIVKKHSGKGVTEETEKAIVKDLLKIITEDPNATDKTLEEIIIAVCNNEQFSDSVTIRLLSGVIKSEEFSTKAAVNALKSEESNPSDTVLKRILVENAKKFKPNTRVQLLGQISDSKIKIECAKSLMDLVYSECSQITDIEAADRLRDISMASPNSLENNDIVTKTEDIIAKKIAENYYKLGTSRVYIFTDIISYLKLMEDKIEDKVQKEYDSLCLEEKSESRKPKPFYKEGLKAKIQEEYARNIGRAGEPFIIPRSDAFKDFSLDQIAEFIKQIEVGSGRASSSGNKSSKNSPKKPFTAKEIKNLITQIINSSGKTYEEKDLTELVNKIETARNIIFTDSEKKKLISESGEVSKQNADTASRARVLRLLKASGFIHDLQQVPQDKLPDLVEMFMMMKDPILEKLEGMNNNRTDSTSKKITEFPEGPEDL